MRDVEDVARSESFPEELGSVPVQFVALGSPDRVICEDAAGEVEGAALPRHEVKLPVGMLAHRVRHHEMLRGRKAVAVHVQPPRRRHTGRGPLRAHLGRVREEPRVPQGLEAVLVVDGRQRYVWLDALTNYITATGWPVDGPAGDVEKHERLWPADLHMVGKDILRFHAVYWPAFLMAAELPLPKRVYAHGWWTNNGQKISKSLGNAIDPNQLAETYGVDQTRYFLMREVPFGNDGDFSIQAMTQRMNGDLANDLGNLSQRVLSMVFKNCNGIMPALPTQFNVEDEALITSADALLKNVRQHIDNQAFHEALRVIWQVISEANRYVDTTAPWALKKTDPVRMGEVLAVLGEAIRQIAILLQPVMPASAGRILDQLGIDPAHRDFSFLNGAERLASGQQIAKPEPVFPRFMNED